MSHFAAGYDAAFELEQTVINLVLDRVVQSLQGRSQQWSLGIGTLSATLTDVRVDDVRPDTANPPGVLADLEVEVDFNLRLFGVIRIGTAMVLRIQRVELDLSRTNAGLPRGLVLAVTPQLAISLTFPARGPAGFLLNRILGPFVALGIWMAFRLIRRVEIPVWDLVDVFAVLGLQMTQASPLLTAQNATPPSSVLLGTDFVLPGAAVGDPNRFGHFLQPSTNAGVVIHEVLLSAAANIAMAKGWAPTRIRVGRWRVFINSLAVDFQPGTVRVFGSIRAKRGRCWCKVKARITFDVGVSPSVVLNPATPPRTTPVPALDVTFNANLSNQVSTSGMLALLATIVAMPLFLAVTIAASFLINIVLQRFLPFTLSFQVQGNQMLVQVQSVHVQGFVPLSFTLPLALAGRGQFDLTPWEQFQLSGGANLDVGFLPSSMEINDDELRLAVELS